MATNTRKDRTVQDRSNAWEVLMARLGPGYRDNLKLVGRFRATLYEYAGGPVIAELDWHNTVVNVGKNLMISTVLTGSSYTAGTIYMGLITTSGFSAIAATDTMASHSGWAESTTFGSTRPSISFGSASGGSISDSAAVNFTATGSDTIKGAFIVQGGTSAEGNTTGTLFSAGVFGTAQPWISGNTLAVSYTLSV